MKNKIEVALFILVLVVGIFFRLYKIDTVPFGTNHDGAWSAIWANEISQHPLPIRVYHENGWLGEAMTRYIMAVFVKFFGPTILAERLGMTIFTIFALPLLFLLIKTIYKSYPLAIFSTFLLAVSGWDMTFAKSGWRTPAVPMFCIATMYFLWQATKTNKTKYFVVTGILLALTLNTYNAAQFMPFTIIGWLIYYFFRQKKQVNNLKNITLLAVFFLIFISPLALYAFNHWENFKGRNDSLFLGNRIKMAGNLNPLVENVQKIASMYNIRGGGDDFFISEPLLDFPANYLFLFGLIIVLLKFRKKENLFLLLWFSTSLIPSFAGTPNGSHAMGSLPPVYIFAGIGLLKAYEFIKKNKTSKKYNSHYIFVILLLAAGAYTTFNLYFGPNRRELWGFYPETTIVGNFMKPRIKNADFYLTDNYPRDALTYLTYQGGDPWEKHYTWFEDKNSFLTVDNQSGKDMFFIMFNSPENQIFLKQLEEKFPHGTRFELRYVDDNINRFAALVFEVRNIR